MILLIFFNEVMEACLGPPKEFAHIWRASGRVELAESHIPVIIHEDAVPHFAGAF